MNALMVAVGSGLGGLCRWQLGAALQRRYGSALVAGADTMFPIGTLLVNVSGSFLAGMLAMLLTRRGGSGSAGELLLLVGFCGGYTTFSTFSVDTVTLIERGSPGLATVNALVSLMLAFVATLAGMLLVRTLLVARSVA